MAEITWPSTLPDNFLQSGYSEGNVDNLIKSKMSSGPDKRRPRTTMAYMPITASMNLTGEQKTIFESFYLNDITFGSMPFIIHTYDSQSIQVYLDSKSITPLAGTKWKLTMNLKALIGAT